MSLLEEIEVFNQPRTTGCRVAEIIASLDKSDRDDLEAALANPAIQHRAIGKALSQRGFALGNDGKTIARHRKGECACHR